MLLHITNVDKEHDDDNDDDGDDVNAHNLINAGKKRKILYFFIIRIDLRINILQLDDDFKQSSQDTQGEECNFTSQS